MGGLRGLSRSVWLSVSQSAYCLENVFSAADLLVWPDLLCVSVTVLFGWGVVLAPAGVIDGLIHSLDGMAGFSGFLGWGLKVSAGGGGLEFGKESYWWKGVG